MTKARHQHRRPEADARRTLGDARQRDPHVAVERRRVVSPEAAVAECFGEHGVVDDVEMRRQGAGDVHAYRFTTKTQVVQRQRPGAAAVRARRATVDD